MVIFNVRNGNRSQVVEWYQALPMHHRTKKGTITKRITFPDCRGGEAMLRQGMLSKGSLPTNNINGKAHSAYYYEMSDHLHKNGGHDGHWP